MVPDHDPGSPNGRTGWIPAAAVELSPVDRWRLSGGNQQKVTIARWLDSGVRTFLFYDPTRGIDIGTKREIYQLVRDLAAAGGAVLLLTSELEEIQHACDRAIVIYGGRVVAEFPASEADEPTLLRAAHGLPDEAGDAA